MATMYCRLCNRPVEAKRQIGVGTAALAVLSGGLWLLAIPFYQKRCSICKTTALTSEAPRPALAAGEGGAHAQLPARMADMERRLQRAEGELETAYTQLDRVRTERDFYRELLGDRVPPGGTGQGGG